MIVKSITSLLYQFGDCTLTISPQQRWKAEVKDNEVRLSRQGTITFLISKQEFNTHWEEY